MNMKIDFENILF